MEYPVKIVTTQKENLLNITWNPNNVCNFKCRYCYPNANTGEFGSPTDLDLVTKNFNFLLQQYKEKLGKTQFHLKIGGGEPTLWKDLDKFIYKIKQDNDLYISLLTNGSRTIRWWKENGHMVDNVHLSYHAAQADLDHTMAVADIMYDLGKKITVKVLMDLTCWDKCVKAVDYLKKNSRNRFMITVAEVVEPEVFSLSVIKEINRTDLQHTVEQKKYLSKGLKRIPGPWWFWKNRHLITQGQVPLYESVAILNNGKKVKAKTETYINRNWHRFKGWKCNLGLETIHIDNQGYIRGSCTEYVYGLNFRYNILSSDFVSNFNLNPVPVVCTKYNCLCTSETHVSKSKF
jgi:organic radical activating enzyme